LLSANNGSAQYAIEYPYHQFSYVERPFNKNHLDHELKQQVMFSPFIRPILSLAGLCRYNDALKLLLHTQQQQLPPGLDDVLLRLKVQLLLEMHKYEAAVPLLKPAVSEQQGWALWALFRIRYERGDMHACAAFLAEPSEELARYPERRELWQLYFAIKAADFAKAARIAHQIPYVTMSAKMVRLVHLVFVEAGETALAIEFIERKRRLAVRGDLYVQLTSAQIRTVLRQMRLCQDPEQKQKLAEQIQHLLEVVRQDKKADCHELSIAMLQTAFIHLHDSRSAALAFWKRYQQMSEQEQSIPVLCHAAMLMSMLGDTQLATDYLFKASRAFANQLDNSHRVFCSCVHQYSFQRVVPPEQRASTYISFAEQHLQFEEKMAAAKMLLSAWQLKPGDIELQQRLYSLLRQLGLSRFRGITVPPLE
jgi:tetratricopeptide (TPR) repeat protein